MGYHHPRFLPRCPGRCCSGPAAKPLNGGIYGTQGTIHATKGIASIYRLETREPFATVTVGDTKVMDVAPLTDHSVIIQGHEPGTTNLIFLNSEKVPIKDIAVVVDDQGSGFVEIHNKKLLNSFTMFSC
jgi:hypothetical protein